MPWSGLLDSKLLQCRLIQKNTTVPSEQPIGAFSIQSFGYFQGIWVDLADRMQDNVDLCYSLRISLLVSANWLSNERQSIHLDKFYAG